MKTKYCPICCKVLPVEEFDENTAWGDGYECLCRSCYEPIPPEEEKWVLTDYLWFIGGALSAVLGLYYFMGAM